MIRHSLERYVRSCPKSKGLLTTAGSRTAKIDTVRRSFIAPGTRMSRLWRSGLSGVGRYGFAIRHEAGESVGAPGIWAEARESRTKGVSRIG